MSEKLIRTGDVAASTGLPEGYIRRLARRGIIPSVRPIPGGSRYYKLSVVERALDIDSATLQSTEAQVRRFNESFNKISAQLKRG